MDNSVIGKTVKVLTMIHAKNGHFPMGTLGKIKNTMVNMGRDCYFVLFDSGETVILFPEELEILNNEEPSS